MKPELARSNFVAKRGRALPACSHGDCEEHSVWDFNTCWKHMTLAEQQACREKLAAALRAKQDLASVVLTGADLSGFDFEGAELPMAFLDLCNLRGATLSNANLKGAYLGWADLTNAKLNNANLDRAVLTNARMYNVELTANAIGNGKTPINLYGRHFKESYRSSKRPRISETWPYSAEATYRELKRYFICEGQYDDASWASFCERLMQRKVLWSEKKFFTWFAQWLFGIVCGHGEKPLRVVTTAVFLIAAFGSAYAFLGSVAQVSGVGHRWAVAEYFSAATFCGYSFPDLVPTTALGTRFLITLEAFSGVFFLGLFIFTLTKRYVAR